MAKRKVYKDKFTSDPLGYYLESFSNLTNVKTKKNVRNPRTIEIVPYFQAMFVWTKSPDSVIISFWDSNVPF